MTGTGVPFPMTAWSAGETIVRVGPAARTPGAESPRTSATRAPARTNTSGRMLKIVRSERWIPHSSPHSSAFLSTDELASILNLGVVRCGPLYPENVSDVVLPFSSDGGKNLNPRLAVPVVGGGAGGSYDSGEASPGRGVHMACAMEHAKQRDAGGEGRVPRGAPSVGAPTVAPPRRHTRFSAVDRGMYTKVSAPTAEMDNVRNSLAFTPSRARFKK